MPIVALSRPLPGEFALPDVRGAEVRVGASEGFRSREASIEFFRGADAIVSWVTDRIDGEFLDGVGVAGAGGSLRIVSNFAVGYDNIDVAACRERGVIVTNTPDAVTDGTADVAVMLMLAAARRLSHADRYVRSGGFTRDGVLNPDALIGLPVAGRTLLIVGAGRIGLATANRMIGWNMDVTYHSRTRKPEYEEPPLNGEWVGLDEGLARADFVSIHVPLSAETYHLIDAKRLSLLKSTAVLVNTARGPVVDESALVDALKAGRLYAAGLDVYEREPEVHPGLRELDNVVLTPHYGSANERSRGAMTALCAANINAVLSGRDPVTPVG